MENTGRCRADSVTLYQNAKFEERCVCCICLNIPHPDFAVCHQACGRIFCESCLKSSCAIKKVCPFCRRYLERIPGLVRDECHFIYAYMAEITVHCPLQDNGCTWKGERILLEGHLEICPYGLVECIFGCGTKMYRWEFYEHSKRCESTKKKCESCLKLVFLAELKEHTMKCLGDSKVNCPFKKLGCGWKGKKCNLLDHLQQAEEKHDKLVEEAKRIDDKNVKNLKEKLKKAEKKITELANGKMKNEAKNIEGNEICLKPSPASTQCMIQAPKLRPTCIRRKQVFF
eukprot:TRINITY_DN1929_c0_g1_i1.p1 TRINITY_DN1929_c0_g1~~TRINITY_DN1929_c0_g1_i1.p1  ORF type:complete len:325 (+),score=1.78 TRINITY_DN1929_c0_g1_i1:119-976(+)